MLIKDEKAMADRWGKRPSDRSVGELLQSGVIAMDKPSGPTSHQVTAWARDILNVKKIGHGGTLDPNVSGVLPLCLGNAVRLTDLVLSSDKEYICLMRLHKDRQDKKIRDVISNFIGKIYQFPPVRSAVKRQLRIRTIASIDIMDIKGRDVLFKVSCDAGTYIRTLCIDIGEALGCGANMVELRRTRSGAMGEEKAATLHDIKDSYVFWQQDGREEWLRSILMPIEVLVQPLPKLIVKASAVDAICHGADLNVQGIHMMDDEIRKNGLAALMTARGELIAIGKMAMSSPKIMAATQGKAVSVERVIMKAGTYPKMWKFSTDLDEVFFDEEAKKV
jgi:rRNA pseudouridine synthase, putative